MESHWPPSMTLLNWVLGPPTEGQETTLAIIEIPQQTGVLRPHGRAHPSLHTAPNQLPIHPPGVLQCRHFHLPQHWQ